MHWKKLELVVVVLHKQKYFTLLGFMQHVTVFYYAHDFPQLCIFYVIGIIKLCIIFIFEFWGWETKHKLIGQNVCTCTGMIIFFFTGMNMSFENGFIRKLIIFRKRLHNFHLINVFVPMPMRKF